MRTSIVLFLLTACAGGDDDTGGEVLPVDGCLSAPARVNLVNRESSDPVSRAVALSNTCGVEITAALSIVDADGVTVQDDLTSVGLPDGEATSITLAYLPDAPGETTGRLTVTPDVAELGPVDVEISAEAPGSRWSIGLLIQDALVRECPGEMQIRFENIGDGKGVRPKASVVATDADVRLTRSVLPEEGAANLTASPVVLHALEAGLVVTVEDGFAGNTDKSFTVDADPLAEREELFAAGETGPVTLAETPLEPSILVIVDDVAVPGWTLDGVEITLPESVDRSVDDVVVQYVAASACGG